MYFLVNFADPTYYTAENISALGFFLVALSYLIFLGIKNFIVASAIFMASTFGFLLSFNLFRQAFAVFICSLLLHIFIKNFHKELAIKLAMLISGFSHGIFFFALAITLFCRNIKNKISSTLIIILILIVIYYLNETIINKYIYREISRINYENIPILSIIFLLYFFWVARNISNIAERIIFRVFIIISILLGVLTFSLLFERLTILVYFVSIIYILKYESNRNIIIFNLFNIIVLTLNYGL